MGQLFHVSTYMTWEHDMALVCWSSNC